MKEGREVEKRVCGRVEGRELEVHGMYEMEEWRRYTWINLESPYNILEYIFNW